MLKSERHHAILQMIEKSEFVSTNDIIKALNVSDMTVRRDLEELSNNGKLIRLHGGAQKKSIQELSHSQKKEIHIKEKKEISKIAASTVQEGESIFLGPGTTNELLVEQLAVDTLRIITNSLPVFEAAVSLEKDYEIYLLGGSFRKRSGAFIGTITENAISTITVDRAFIGVNGITKDSLFNANFEEGKIHQLILNNARKKIVVADYHKINRNDFYSFYSLEDIDTLITNKDLDNDIYEEYSSIITIQVQ